MCILIAAIVAVFMFSCETTTATTTDSLVVTSPDSTAIIEQATPMTIHWQYAQGSTVNISIFNDQGIVAILDSAAVNDGEYIYPQVSKLLLPSKHYRVKVIDGQGKVAWSQFFEIKNFNEPLPLPDPTHDSPSR